MASILRIRNSGQVVRVVNVPIQLHYSYYIYTYNINRTILIIRSVYNNYDIITLTEVVVQLNIIKLNIMELKFSRTSSPMLNLQNGTWQHFESPPKPEYCRTDRCLMTSNLCVGSESCKFYVNYTVMYIVSIISFLAISSNKIIISVPNVPFKTH